MMEELGATESETESKETLCEYNAVGFDDKAHGNTETIMQQ